MLCLRKKQKLNERVIQADDSSVKLQMEVMHCENYSIWGVDHRTSIANTCVDFWFDRGIIQLKNTKRKCTVQLNFPSALLPIPRRLKIDIREWSVCCCYAGVRLNLYPNIPTKARAHNMEVWCPSSTIVSRHEQLSWWQGLDGYIVNGKMYVAPHVCVCFKEPFSI